jgi:predicted permease
MSLAEARRRARLRLGGIEQTKEIVRDARATWIDSVWRDVHFALRTYRANPVPALVAIAVLALGIAAGTVTFSVVEGVVLRSMPFPQADRLVDIKELPLKFSGERVGGATVSDFVFERLRTAPGRFAGMAGYVGQQPVLTGLGDAERIRIYDVTSNFFPVLGVAPAVGRGFLGGEDRPGLRATVVLSYGFWTSRFGRDAGVLGQTVTLDGNAAEIVGIMPAQFDYPAGTAMWRAIGGSRLHDTYAGPQGRYSIVGRLRPRMTLTRAQADMDAISRRIGESAPDCRNWTANLTPLQRYLIYDVRGPLLLVLGAVGFVLLVACGNVANVLLARAVARRREVAVRLALGATRARIARQFLTESLLLALAGGAAGVLLSIRGLPLLLALADTELPRVADIGLNWRVLAASALATVLTGLLFGLAPALHSVRRVAPDSFRFSSEAPSRKGWRSRPTDALLVGQIALTMVLLTGAALLATSFVRLMRVDPGFDADCLVAVELRLPSRSYPADTARWDFVLQAMERVRALPGVARVAIASGMPLQMGAIGTIGLDGREVNQAAWFTSVTSDFFRVLRVPLTRGRSFAADGRETKDAIIVNEAFARQYLRGADPLGHVVTFFGTRKGVIAGVVADTRDRSLASEPEPQIYIPYRTLADSFMKILVRTTVEPGSVVKALRGALRDLDGALPIDRIVTVQDVIAESTARQRFFTLLVGIFACLAVLTAACGIYGVAMYAASRRTYEMGIRLALGARRWQMVRLIVGRHILLASLGVAIGAAGALATTRLLARLLFQVRPTEPLVFLAVGALLAGVAALASYLPARRAARVDPVVSLRCQ